MSTLRPSPRPALVAAALVSLSPLAARAEPPLMKEQSVEPRIQAVSPDGRYSISLGGFLQARYSGALVEGEKDLSQFGSPRTRFYSYGYVHSTDFRYRLMVGTPPFSQQMQVYDAYVEAKVSHALRLRAGRFKLPVFREWVESARLLASVDRSPIAQLLLPGRDYGLMASGALGHETLEYSVGAFNGAGDVAAVESNTSPAVAGRVVWNATGRSIEGEVDFDQSPASFAVGVSGYSTWKPVKPSAVPEPEAPHLREHMGGVEAVFRQRGLDVAAELMVRRREHQGRIEDVGGGYLRVTKLVPSIKTSLGARGTWITGSSDASPRRAEVEAEVGYYIEEHDLKFAADVGQAWLGRDRKLERFVQAQAQVSF